MRWPFLWGRFHGGVDAANPRRVHSCVTTMLAPRCPGFVAVSFLPGEMPPQLMRDRLILVAACWECAGVVVGLPDLELATFKRRTGLLRLRVGASGCRARCFITDAD